MAGKVGRPLKYKTVKELQSVIDEYFAYCDNRTKSMYVKELGDNIQISDPAPYTMSGLALAIGLSRQGLLDYSNRDEFLDTIKTARAKVENDVETRLLDGKAPAGAIFNLKNNFGWRDKSEVDNKVSIETPILGGMSKDVSANDSDQKA